MKKGVQEGINVTLVMPPWDPQSDRCFNCSAVRHFRRECPLKAAGFDSKLDQEGCQGVQKVTLKKRLGEATPERVTGLLSEATTRLKTLKPAAPDGPTGLLDGGENKCFEKGNPSRIGRC